MSVYMLQLVLTAAVFLLANMALCRVIANVYASHDYLGLLIPAINVSIHAALYVDTDCRPRLKLHL